MELRTLGTTELKVSSISLGASSLGGGVFGSVSEQDAIRTVQLALDRGMRLIDVAPFYGDTRAEEVLGRALKGIPRDRYILTTKVGRYANSEFDFSAGRAAASLDESLRRLGVDYVDLIQVHDIEYGDHRQIVSEAIPALRQLVYQGKARYVGVTGYPLKALLRVADEVPLDTVLSYNHATINDNSLVDALPSFTSRGIGVMNAAPFSQGLLTDKGPAAWHPAPAAVKAICADVVSFVRSRGGSMAKLALQYSTQKVDVVTTVVGVTSPVEVETNLRWLEEPLDEEILEVVLQKLSDIRNTTWVVGRSENN
jgi:L-galactose dehydrogenase